MRARRSDRGFTLLELMVCLTLMVAVAGLGFGGLRMGNQVWDRTETRAQARLDTYARDRFLQTLLGSAVPLTPRSAQRNPPVLFTGNPNSVRLVTRLPSHLAPEGEYLVDLALDPSKPEGSSRDLQLAWQRLGARKPTDRPDGVEVLASDVLNLSFTYDDGNQQVWRDKSRLPRMIELTLESADQSGSLTVWLPQAMGAPDV